MKKVLVFAGVIVFFLGLVALVLFKLFNSTSGTPLPAQNSTLPASGSTNSNPVTTALKNIDTTSPQNTVYACYTWYLQYSNTAQISQEIIHTNPTIAHCFTPDFVTKWSASFGTQDYVDPVVIATDFDTSWITTNVDVNLSNLTSNSSSVSVTLGKGGNEEKILKLHLRKEYNDWKIDFVENPG